MPGVAITGRGMTRDYPAGERSLAALDHVDLDVTSGSLVAITGPSGSGKSTLLHVIVYPQCISRVITPLPVV